MNMTTSASCSMAPDSRKSESCGPRSSRSGARVNWLSTRTGICSSFARPFGHAAPILAIQVSGAEFVCVNLSDRRDEALEQRLLRHFKAEDCHRPAAANGDVFGEVQRQGRFALRWPRGKNQQFGVLQAAQ